jgi:membrane protein
MKKRIIKMITLGIKQFRDPYYQGFAGQLAFYFILSLVPIIILVSQIAGAVFGASLDSLVEWLLKFASGEVAETIKRLLSYKVALGSNIFLLLVALWASSRARFAMVRITNFTMTDGRTTGNGYFRERFRAVVSMSITILTLIMSLVVLVYGQHLLELALTTMGIEDFAPQLWLVLRWPLAAGMYFFMISYDYYSMPSTKVRYREIIPGSIFAAVGVLLVTWIYSLYVDQIMDYDILYGSLANLVALMFWFYFIAWVLCLGMLFNKVWIDTSDDLIVEQID